MNAPDDPSLPAERPRPARTSRRTTVLVAVVGVLIVLGAVALPLIKGAVQDREQVLSSNSAVTVSESGRIVEAGRSTCQKNVYMPSGGRILRVFPGYAGRRAPRLTFTVLHGGQPVTQTSLLRPYPSGQPLPVRIADVPASNGATVCIRNEGPGNVSIADARTAFGSEQEPPVRIDVLTGRAPDTVALVPAALERAGRFKSVLVGPIVIAILGLLVVFSVVAVVVVAFRDRTEDSA